MHHIYISAHFTIIITRRTDDSVWKSSVTNRGHIFSVPGMSSRVRSRDQRVCYISHSYNNQLLQGPSVSVPYAPMSKRLGSDAPELNSPRSLVKGALPLLKLASAGIDPRQSAAQASLLTTELNPCSEYDWVPTFSVWCRRLSEIWNSMSAVYQNEEVHSNPNSDIRHFEYNNNI